MFKLNINNNTFEYIDTESGPFKLKSKHINRLLIDDTGTLFIATYAGGVPEEYELAKNQKQRNSRA